MSAAPSTTLATKKAVASAVSTVFVVLLILQMLHSWQLSEVGGDRIAPENLRDAPDYFAAKLAVEVSDFPLEQMKQTAAWKELEASAGGYADRLNVMSKHDLWATYGILLLYVVSGFASSHYTRKCREGDPPWMGSPQTKRE